MFFGDLFYEGAFEICIIDCMTEINWIFTNILKFVLYYKQRIDEKRNYWCYFNQLS
jgi:hypothetical protein